MDVGKRLLRKPVQTILWQVILIAMALLLGVGSVLMYAANALPKVLDAHHTTIAVQKMREERTEDGRTYSTVTLMPEQLQALEELDMVKSVDMRTLTGAYVPNLTAQVGLSKWGNVCAQNYDYARDRFLNNSYNQVILTGTVEKAWMISENEGAHDLSALGHGTSVERKYAYAILEIEDILVANPAYDFFPTEEFTDYCGKVIVQAVLYDETGENYFREGQRYLVSGSYDPACHGYGISVQHTPDGVLLPWVKLTERFALTGTIAFRKGAELTAYQQASYFYPIDGNSPVRLTSAENPIPLAVELEGTPEEFLAANPQWAEVVNTFEMTQHSFPVLGTACLESMQYFVTNAASITQGRTFTQEEYDTGAKVCVISESVAQTGNVQVGDTIALSQYLCCDNERAGNPTLSAFNGLTDPSLGEVPFPNGLPTDEESFTVVGIYRLERSWEAASFSFTPNTIFMPQKAQIPGGFGGCSETVQELRHVWHCDPQTGEFTGDADEWVDIVQENGTSGVFLSVILENGRMEDFLEALSDIGLADREMLTFDQGYEAARESVQAVIDTTEKLFLAAAGGWLLLLLLYVLLYQSRERRNLGVMRSVGAKPSALRRYLFISGLLPAAVGVTVGTLLSDTVAALVQDKLIELTLTQAQSNLHSGGTALDNSALAGMLAQSEMPVAGLLLLAAAQLAVIALVLWLHGAMLAGKKPRKLLGV